MEDITTLLQKEVDSLIFKKLTLCGLQDKLKKLGTSGCYIMAILSGSGISSIDDIVKITDGFIKDGLLSDDYAVKDNVELAKSLGLKYEWKCKATEEEMNTTLFCVKEYYNERTGYTHFVLHMDKQDYDTLENSITVRDGIIKSYRMFY